MWAERMGFTNYMVERTAKLKVCIACNSSGAGVVNLRLNALTNGDSVEAGWTVAAGMNYLEDTVDLSIDPDDQYLEFIQAEIACKVGTLSVDIFAIWIGMVYETAIY